MASAGSIFVDLLLNDAKFTAGTKRASKEVKTFADATSKATSLASSSFAKLGASIAAAISVGSFVAITKSSLQVASALKDTSERLQVTTSDLQKYQYAAKLVGIGNEGLESGLIKLNAKIAEGELKYKSTTEALQSIAEAVQNARTGTEKLAIVNDAFGAKIGAKFLPLLSSGSEGLKKLGEEAEATGNVIKDSTVDATDRFADSMDVLGSTIKNNFQSGFLSAFVSGSIDLKNIYTDPQFKEGMEGIGKAIGGISKFMLDATVNAGLLIGKLIELENRGNSWARNLDERFFRALGGTGNEGEIRTGTAISDAMGPPAPFGPPSSMANVSNTIPPYVSSKINKEAESSAEKAQKALDKWIVSQKEAIETLALESEYIGKTSVEIEKLKDARAIDTAFAEKSIGLNAEQVQKYKEQAEAIKQTRAELIQYNYEFSRSAAAGASEFFAQYTEDATNSAEQIKGVLQNAFKAAEDALLQFVKTGKLNFKELASSIIDDLLRIQIQRQLASVVDSVSGGLGNILGSFFGGSGSLKSPVTNSAGKAVGTYPKFATGIDTVPYDMAAIIHQDEAVLNKADAKAWRNGGGKGNTYTIDARGADQGAVRRIEQALLALAGPGVIEQRVSSAQGRGEL